MDLHCEVCRFEHCTCCTVPAHVSIAHPIQQSSPDPHAPSPDPAYHISSPLNHTHPTDASQTFPSQVASPAYPTIHAPSHAALPRANLKYRPCISGPRPRPRLRRDFSSLLRGRSFHSVVFHALLTVVHGCVRHARVGWACVGPRCRDAEPQSRIFPFWARRGVGRAFCCVRCIFDT